MIKQPCVCLCPALLSATLTTLLTVLCNWGEKGGGEGLREKVRRVVVLVLVGGGGHCGACRSGWYEGGGEGGVGW